MKENTLNGDLNIVPVAIQLSDGVIHVGADRKLSQILNQRRCILMPLGRHWIASPSSDGDPCTPRTKVTRNFTYVIQIGKKLPLLSGDIEGDKA